MARTYFGQVAIEAFRGLRGLTLEECGPVNLLVGSNNSGKTTVLEALLLMTGPTDVGQWEAAAELRGTWPLVDMRFRGGRLERLDALGWLFPRHDGVQLPIEIKVAGGAPVSWLLAKAERITGTPPERPTASMQEFVEGATRFSLPNKGVEEVPAQGLIIDMLLRREEGQVSFTSAAEQEFRMVLWERGRDIRTRAKGPVAPIAFATPISHRSDGYVTSRFSRLTRSKRIGQAVELLQVLDPKIRDLVLVSPEETEADSVALPLRDRSATLHVEHSTAGLVPLQALGDGTRRAVHLATLLADIGAGGVLLIDEIEAGMHTTVLRDVFRWLGEACRERNIQLFATTHSLEAVDSILEAVPDPDLVLYRIRAGEARRYDGPLLRTARVELGQEVR